MLIAYKLWQCDSKLTVITSSIIYFKLAEITNGNEAEKLQIWAKYRQKVTKLSNQLQATNGLKNPLFLAR